MSYNRGGNMRRDTGRRSNDFGGGGNRRGGGGGYGNYGGSNYGNNYSSQMNPWEGGMVPGRGGNSGLMQTTGQGDLLSQLTSPEAQLALASNLINKLITQQQQSTPQMLNLGNMGSGGGHMASYGDGYGNTRNFQDRRRGRMDQRRTEPYNKSGMNRHMGNDRRNLGKNRMGSDRRSSAFSKSPKFQKEDKDKKDTEKPNGDIETKSSDEPKREEDAAKGKEEETEVKEDGEKKKQIEKAPPIPPALLYCHVCCKNMWDEVSFTKHTKGRPHQLMMDGVNEKYKLKVDLLRHEMRLAEQQREMEIERKQRQGIKMFNHPREYCAMCDLHFYGNLISHRKNIRHQKLKSFLHPKCSHCNKEFSTRLEWDDHRLTFSHLKKVAEYRRATKPHLKDDEFDIEELVNPDNVNCGEMVAKEVPVLTSHPSEEDITMENIKEEPLKERDDIKKEKEEDGKADESVTEENKEETKEPEAPQGIDIDPGQLPKYNPSNVIGKDLLVPVTGFVCRICNRFIPGQEDATVHCRTLTHHTNFCNTVRAKARVSGRRKKQKSKEAKAGGDKKDKEETDGSPTKIKAEPDTAEDDEGNWKRRKTEPASTDVSMNDDSKMEVDESKNGDDDGAKDDVQDSVWEEVDKDADIKKEEEEKEEDEVEEETETATRQTTRGGRGGRGRRGGRRGK